MSTPTDGADTGGGGATVDRFDAWAELLDRAFVRLEPAAAGRCGGFRGDVCRVALDGVSVARADACAHRVHRLPGHVRGDARDVRFANLQVRGGGRVLQRGRAATAAPCDLTSVVTSEPFTIAHDAPFALYSFTLERSRLGAPRDGGPLLAPLSRTPTGRRVAALIRDHAELALGRDAHEAPLPGLGPRLLELFDYAIGLGRAGASGAGDPGACDPDPGGRDAPRGAPGPASLEAWVRAHAHRPDTDVRRCAEAFGISVRAVHRGFETLGRTFNATLTDARLERAAHLLGSTDADVGRIAHASGFGDASYLARRFRARHGASPTAWRRARRAGR